MDTPSAIDGYRIAAVIAEGRLGAVYKAFDPRADRFVAVRTVRKVLADTPVQLAALSAFRADALAILGLHHPNIATFGAFSAEGEVAYLASEVSEGRALADYLHGRQLSPAQAAGFGLQVLAALEYAHVHGVVHGAVNPWTVTVGEGMQLKIGDFWPAGGVHGSLGDPPTEDALPFLAPEQRMGEAADGRSDIYAAGALMFFMLTSARPDDCLSANRRSLAEIDPTVPHKLNAVVGRAMALDRNERFESIQEFASALNGAAATVARPALARPAVAPPPGNSTYGRRQCAAGDYLFRQGQPGDAAYIVESGSVRILRRLEDGREIVLATLGRGEIVGEMALIDDKPRIASAQAAEDCVLVVVPRDDFAARLAKVDKVTQKLLSTVVRRLRVVDDEVTLLKQLLG